MLEYIYCLLYKELNVFDSLSVFSWSSESIDSLQSTNFMVQYGQFIYVGYQILFYRNFVVVFFLIIKPIYSSLKGILSNDFLWVVMGWLHLFILIFAFNQKSKTTIITLLIRKSIENNFISLFIQFISAKQQSFHKYSKIILPLFFSSLYLDT